jgi:hypothetical protein
MKKFLIITAMMLSVFNINAEEKSDKYYATVLSVSESIKNVYEAIEKEIKSKPSREEADEHVRDQVLDDLIHIIRNYYLCISDEKTFKYIDNYGDLKEKFPIDIILETKERFGESEYIKNKYNK